MKVAADRGGKSLLDRRQIMYIFADYIGCKQTKYIKKSIYFSTYNLHRFAKILQL